MDKITFPGSYSKDMLRYVLDLKRTTFKSWMNTLEPEILKVDPHYGKRNLLVIPKVFRFVVEEYGLDAEEVNKRILEYKNMINIRNRIP